MTMILVLLNNFMPLMFKTNFGHMGAAIGSNKAQCGSSIFDHFIEQLGLYINSNAANFDFQVV